MKRFDKGYIYSGLLTDFFYSVFLVFILLKDFFLDEESASEDIATAAPFFAIGFIVIYLCFVVYRIMYYKTSGYELTDKEIKCNRGVLFRKRSVLDYKKVHAINKKQNIIQRIFGIAVLTVDSGSANTSHQAEITIIEKNAVVDSLLDELNSLKESGVRSDASAQQAEEVLLSDKDSMYHFTSGKKMLYTLINIASTAFFTALFAVLSIIVIGLGKGMLQLDFLGTWGQYFLYAILITAGAILLFSIFSFIGSIVHSFVGYYDFTVTKRDNNIQISYGLLEKHTNTFSYDRIKAVKISQGLVQRILGFASIKLEVIGYTVSSGDSDNNAGLGILIPFCKYDEIDEILGKVLPDYIPTEKKTKSVSIFPFMSWFLLIFGITVGIILTGTVAVMKLLDAPATALYTVTFVTLGLTAIVILIKLASAILAYHTNGLAVENGKITAYSGSFNKNITVFMAKHLVAVETVTTPLRKKRGISSLVMHLKTNESSNEVKVHIQKDTLSDELEKMLML
ncbi:MAG: hypothetical protein E7667_02955 [Ruminococcaceae bacterium]|nr:hypothetical protein [Oscillospiraceae bacterium]